MKRKILAFSLIIFLLGLSSFANAQIVLNKNLKNETDNPNPAEFIDYFDWGIITGTYEIEKYNSNGQLVLKNEDYSKTIRIIGVGWYYVGDMPYKTFGWVKTSKVIIEEFHGFINNGRIFGIGLEYIDYAR